MPPPGEALTPEPYSTVSAPEVRQLRGRTSVRYGGGGPLRAGGGRAEVVDRCPADRLRRVVRLDPGRDLRGVFGGSPRGGARGAGRAGPARHEVVDLVVSDQLLERGQARRRIGAAEPADRHDRVAAGAQLHRGGLVRADGGRRPLVARRAVLKQLHEGGADRRVAAGEGAEARGGPHAGPAVSAVAGPVSEGAWPVSEGARPVA